jgi:hypothetical protein
MAYFQTKNSNWVNYGGTCNGRCWNVFWILGLFLANRYTYTCILCLFGIFCNYLVYIFPFGHVEPRKDLATLPPRMMAIFDTILLFAEIISFSKVCRLIFGPPNFPLRKTEDQITSNFSCRFAISVQSSFFYKKTVYWFS